MLAIQRHIIEYGLDATVEKFKLVVKDYSHKVLLKYQQIESPMSEPEVHDARGLVLRKSDWSVMSLAFRKFFNLNEGKGEDLDWNTARFYEKMDGTMIHAYYDDVLCRWCFGTTGTAEGEGPVDNFHWGSGDGSFADLFVKSFRSTNLEYGNQDTMDMDLSFEHDPLRYVSYFLDRSFNRDVTVAFELCTPNNIVVTPHANYRVYLLGVRNLNTMTEYTHDALSFAENDLMVKMPRTFELKDPDEMVRMVATQPFSMEGVVAVDVNFNRRKVKNPAYVAVHFMRDATAYWRIVDVVRSGEIDEYLTYFPGREDEVRCIERKWQALNISLIDALHKIQSMADNARLFDPSSADGKSARKAVAMIIMKIGEENNLGSYRSFLFSTLGNSRHADPDFVQKTADDVRDYLMSCDGHDMFDKFKKMK